jgi:hypothetical protein
MMKKEKKEKKGPCPKEKKEERDGIIQKESIYLSTIFHPHTCTS